MLRVLDINATKCVFILIRIMLICNIIRKHGLLLYVCDTKSLAKFDNRLC